MKKIQLVFIIFVFSHLTNAQTLKKIELAAGDNILLISKVPNGFIKEVPFAEKLNLSAYYGIAVLVANTGDSEFRLEGWLNTNKWVGSSVILQPGEAKTLELFVMRPRDPKLSVFSGMKGLPGGTVSWSPINPEDVSKMTFIVYTDGKASFKISKIEPYGNYIPPQKLSDTPGFYPFVDKWGQYKHGTWPGKIKSESDFKRAIDMEEEELKLLQGPSDRDRFGGWAYGPKLKATGNFRAEKVNGKWWLVDPDGNLFWSHGITCVRFGDGVTRISGRNNYFEGMPKVSGPLTAFYTISKQNDTVYSFLESNLFRKYGSQWKEKASSQAVKRLNSWGMNTYGNWSDPDIYLKSEKRIPYTVGINSGRRGVGFPNVFDPAFRNAVKEAVEEVNPKVVNDLYCIGFFIDNELKVTDLTGQIMSYSADNKTKRKFLTGLKQKYISIEKLNAGWKTSYTGFAQLDTVSKLPVGAKQDKHAFDVKILDRYYQICSEELKKIAPDKIYFGSRLHCHYFPDDQTESDFIKVAAKYCDIVCFNRYRFSPEDLILPFNIDKPTLIGEFHFGALDRGLPYAGLRMVADQNQRADSYYDYVKGALDNPQIVGTHWYQYSDFSFTGLSNVAGANAQVGFIDICDNPYPETINASRKIGYSMYKIRYGESKKE